MGLQFDWQIDDEQNVEVEYESSPKRQHGRVLLALFVLIVLALQAPAYPKPTLSPTITVAVPTKQLTHFRLLAANFMHQHPESVVKIVDAAPFDDSVQLLLAADAAVLTPDVALLETRMLYPLNELAAWDSDFYVQSRSGVTWDEQIWVWPYALQMNVLYSDTLMRAKTSLEPIEAWNFLQFGRQINLLADQNDTGFLLSTRDILFSYAYAHTTPSFDTFDEAMLDETIINETLAWLNRLNAADNAILDLSGLQPMERVLTHLRSVSAERTVALWSDTPSRYEYLTQLNSVTVAPWPQSEMARSVAPLHLHGGVISATSQNPPLAMAWLDFLSHQPPPSGERLIPSRQSVASAQKYWENLPPSFAIQMSDAFDTAQAISISDHSALSWERINHALTR